MYMQGAGMLSVCHSGHGNRVGNGSKASVGQGDPGGQAYPIAEDGWRSLTLAGVGKGENGGIRGRCRWYLFGIYGNGAGLRKVRTPLILLVAGEGLEPPTRGL